MKKYFLFFVLITSSLPVSSQLYFKEVSSSIDFNHTYYQGISGAGLSFVDFNLDGYDDLTVPTNSDQSIYFFINDGNKLIPKYLNIDYPYQVKQILWIDFDNDQDKDLYLTSFNGKNKLFKNLGYLEFEDVTISMNLPDSISKSFGASWADINNDGFLDLLQTYRTADSLQNNIMLFLSDSANTFIDITSNSKILELNKLPFSISFVDIDNNNNPDIYIANDKLSGNSLYYNNGDLSFTDISLSSNTGIEMDGMSVSIGDFNNDLYYDIYSTNLEEGNKFFVNNGDLTFSESSDSLGISFNGQAWGSQFEDFDLDGYEDLYVSGALVGSNVNSSSFYSNIFGKYFEPNNSIGLESDTVSSYGNAIGDIDGNGLPDIAVLNMYPYKSFIFKNTYSGTNNWLKIKLVGHNSNKDGYGTRVELYSNDLLLSRFKSSNDGYISQNSDDLFFGLSENNIIDSIFIYWPSGVVDKLYNLNANQILKVNEGSSSLKPIIYSNSLSFCEGSYLELETGIYHKYLWSNGDTTQKINVFSPGIYFVTVYDENNNAYTSDTINISSTVPINFNLEIKNITTDHSSSIEILDVDTSKNYYVSLDGGSFVRNNFFISNISSGLHEIKIIDFNGCEFIQAFEILNLVKDESNIDFNNQSIARKWMEVLLEAIRNDLARPPVHARNLFHLSSIMYDAFVINKKVNENIDISPFLLNKTIDDNSFIFNFPEKINDDEYIDKIISYSSYNFIRHRFKNSVGVVDTYKIIDSLMVTLDYNTQYDKLDYFSGDPKSIGNYLSQLYIDYGFIDNSNEINDYSSNYYTPINPPLDLSVSGNSDMIDPNRWQPLKILNFIDQSGNSIEGIPEFISPEWGNVLPFSLKDEDLVIKVRDDGVYKVYYDPGIPPLLDTVNQGVMDSIFKRSFSMVSLWGSHLDNSDGVYWDISPKSIGNVQSYPENFLDFDGFYKFINGGDIGIGYDINPISNQEYNEQIVPRGDYTRVLAEFWADGPDSETPPGHWFVILNEVNDNDKLIKKFEGEGEELSNLEWDIKSYFLLGGTMHDVAISAWGIKGYYDYPRPISVIRYLSDKGQSSFPDSLNYNPNGIKLIDNYIELVGVNDSLVGADLENLGKIKLYTWKGFSDQSILEKDIKGSGWVLAEDWWPYQRPSFVTPPFAGYVSGHSTYSRAASVILEKITGSEYFPGGIGEFEISKNNFLVFEKGPSVDMKLQWAKYKDAADQCSLSRIWGGIHPYIDDLPGRRIGNSIAINAFEYGKSLFQESKIITKSIEKNLNNISVFPNPISSNNYLNIINESSNKIKEINIYNFLGRSELKYGLDINSNVNKLNLNGLPNGIYLLKIIFDDNTSRTTKFVINR